MSRQLTTALGDPEAPASRQPAVRRQLAGTVPGVDGAAGLDEEHLGSRSETGWWCTPRGMTCS